MTIGIAVVDRSGALVTMTASARASATQAIGVAGVDEWLAICGGRCSCATCRVSVESDGSTVPATSFGEDDLLNGSLDREPDSRLSCQIPLFSAIDGPRIRMAPEK